MVLSVARDHVAVSVDHDAAVIDARRMVSDLAARFGVDAYDVAIVVAELARNLHEYAYAGEILAMATPGVLDVTAVDRGPGISDLTAAMRDGHSTGDTLGVGLGAVQRLSSRFDIHTDSKGTIAHAQFGGGHRHAQAGLRRARLSHGVGTGVCGDAYAFERKRVAMFDGLGHGNPAWLASRAALDALSAAPLDEVAKGIDVALRGTRGAVGLLIEIHPDHLAVCGAGNVRASVVSRADRTQLVCDDGVFGSLRRDPRVRTHRIDGPAWLVVHTDGVSRRWNLNLPPLQDANLVLGRIYAAGAKERDDVALVVTRVGVP